MPLHNSLLRELSEKNYSKITTRLNGIQNEIQAKKVELIDQEDRVKIQTIYQSANEQLILCNQSISQIKGLRQNTSSKTKVKNTARTLLSLKECKTELLELRKNAEDRLSLIERRQALYGQDQLPATPNFATLLDDLCINHPDLEEDGKHFKQVIESSMGLIPTKLTPGDIQQLGTFAEKLENLPELELLHRAVLSQYISMQSAFERKENLLRDLGAWLNIEGLQNIPFENWSSEQKLYFLVRTDQTLNNPFEAKLEINSVLQALQQADQQPSPIYSVCALIRNLWTEDTKTSQKKDFWNHAPPFERRCHQLADTAELKEYLYMCKIEGLKEIISLRPPKMDANPHLIVGAGPSGLISALTKEMQGLDYQIIEKRSEAKVPRENTITLGKGDPKDLEILFFLGVMADYTRHDKVSLGHNKAPLMEVKIGDVEEGLLQVLEELHGSNPITYNTEISDITVSPSGDAGIRLTNSNGESIAMQPATVTVTDGFSGKTKQLLGISRIDLAKPTMIAYSIFKNVPAEPEIPKTLKYRIKNSLKGIALIVSVAIYKIVKNKPVEEGFAKVIKGGPSAIFRIPDQDYLIRVLRKKEQGILTDYRARIKKLDLKLASLESQPETEQNKAKAKRLQEERDTTHDLFNRRLQRHAEKMHGTLDFFQFLYNHSGHQMKKMPMKSTKDFLVDIQVGKAERDVVIVGQTPFLIRGDASHSTDPYSGYGCKTALEEIQADQNFFNHSEDINNPVGISMLAYGHSFYQRRMINIGLRERHFYRKRTENLSRYVDRAIAHSMIDHTEAGEFLRIHAKNAHRDNPLLTMTEDERLFAAAIRTRLLTELTNSLEARAFQQNGKKRIKDQFPLELTGKEKRLLKKALHQAYSDSPALKAKERKNLEALCGKLTFHDVQEGWMLAMIYQNGIPNSA